MVIKKLSDILSKLLLVCLIFVQPSLLSASTFSDVHSGDWFANYVDQLAQANIISTSNSNFFPYHNLTRAELAKMAVKAGQYAHLLGTAVPGIHTFCDVSSNDWAYSYVEILVAQHIISGVTSTCTEGKNFLPNNAISRAEALKILLGVFQITPGGSTTRFYDVDSNLWYSGYIAKATELGLVNGYSDGSFRPNGFISRAEMSKILARLMQQALPSPTPTISSPSSSPSPSPSPTSSASPALDTSLTYNMGSPHLQEFWISPSGSNDNPGTQSLPFATFGHAWDLVPSSTTLASGFLFHVLPGTYSAPDLYIEDRIGTFSTPIVFQGEGSVTINGNFNSRNLHYVYFINLAFTFPGDTMHFELADHILLRNITLRSPTHGAQENLKVNQSQFFFVEDSDISGAYENPIDFVAVQYGHVVRSKIHDGEDWCMYTKGGSASLQIESNEFFNCGTGGFSAGQGTGFEYMTPPWLHYEAYDIRVVNNIVHNTEGAGLGVNGGYNILMAHNTLYSVGSRSHTLEVVFGSRSCDGELAQCAAHAALGGWGPSSTGSEVFIGDRHVRIFDNIIYNPPSARAADQIFAIYGPRPVTGSASAPNPAVTDADLQIKGNLIWNGTPDTSLGLGDEQGCLPSNPTCNETQLRHDNLINSLEPQLTNPAAGNFSLVNRSAVSSLAVPLPTFSWSDAPTPPTIPSSTTVTNLPYSFYRNGSAASSLFPGAY